MSLESPPRLKHGDLGPILQAADAPVSPERMASNHAAVKAAIAAGLTRSIPLWMKVVVPLVLLVGGYAVYRAVTPSPTAPVVATLAADAAVTVDAPDVPMDADEAPMFDAPDIDAAVDAGMKLAEGSAKKPVVIEVPPDAAPTSDLPAQIALYEQARDAAAKGDVARGIELLDELLQRFPTTQLRSDAELTRADFLTRANRLDDAAAALDALIASPAHRGRRGELWRALGDLRRKQGDCTHAIEAYTHARESTLNAAETAKVQRGIERCTTPQKNP